MRLLSRFIFAFFFAFGAHTAEQQVFFCDCKTVFRFHALECFCVHKRFKDIEHAPAAVADEMAVCRSIAVEMLLPVDDADASRFALCTEFFKIAVNCAET